MDETFKNQLAEFARDLAAICADHSCRSCPLRDDDGPCRGRLADVFFDTDKAIAAVEAYRTRKKPCAEVIDKAVDVYTIEVEVERGAVGATMPAKYFAECAVEELQRYFRLSAQSATVRVLSAKRFVLESHREDKDE